MREGRKGKSVSEFNSGMSHIFYFWVSSWNLAEGRNHASIQSVFFCKWCNVRAVRKNDLEASLFSSYDFCKEKVSVEGPFYAFLNKGAREGVPFTLSLTNRMSDGLA